VDDVIVKDVEQLATMELDSVDEEERMVRCGYLGSGGLSKNSCDPPPVPTKLVA